MPRNTLPEERTEAQVRRSRDLRRVGLTLLVVFVLLGASGVFGTRTGETSASGGGYEVTVTYPKTSRPGHAIRFEVEVHKEGGFGGEPIHLRLLSEYFDLFDENAFDPDPEASTADGTYDRYEFLPPPGEDFVLSVDTRVEPAVQRGRPGEVAVLDEGGAPLVTLDWRTRIWP